MSSEVPVTKPYYVLSAGDSYQLSKRVNQMISDGWQPIGGPVCKDLWYQAMIFRGDDYERRSGDSK